MSSSPSELNGRDLVAILCVVLIWGLNFVTMKLALRDFSAFQLGAMRYLFAALPLVFFVRFPRGATRWLIAYGLSQGVGQFGLLFLALQVGMTASLASVLLQTQVFFTALFSVFVLRETLAPALRVGLILAALGLGCFAMNYVGGVSGAVLAGTTMLGFLLNIASAAMWATSNIVVRRAYQSLPAFDALGFVVWSSLVPIVPFILASLLFDSPEQRWGWLQADALSWFSVAYLGWCATTIGYALWTWLLRRHPANRVAPFSLAVPLIGLIAGVQLLDEVISPWQWGGIVFIGLALGVVVFWPMIAKRWIR